MSLRQEVGEGNGTPLQYSCLENPMDGGPWWAAVHGVAKSRTWLSDFTFTFHFHALEKEMATHSSVLAWRIPGTGEPGGLSSMGLQSRTRLKRLSSSSSSSKARSASDLSLVLEVIQSQLHKNPSSTTTPSSCLKSLQRNYSRYFLWFPLKKIKLRYDGTNSKDIYWLQRIFSFSA